MSEESKNTEIVRLHLTDIYKADLVRFQPHQN